MLGKKTVTFADDVRSDTSEEAFESLKKPNYAGKKLTDPVKEVEVSISNYFTIEWNSITLIK